MNPPPADAVAARAFGVALGIAVAGAVLGVASALGREPSPAASAPAAATSSSPIAASAAVSAHPAPSSSAHPPPVALLRRPPVDLTDDQIERGLDECSLPDPGPGPFGPPRALAALRGGRLFAPRPLDRAPDGGVDVVLHFHGVEAARRAVVRAGWRGVLAGFDLGTGSAPYAEPFRHAPAFGAVRDAIERALRDETGDPSAHVRRLAISAWSAGYGAVNAIVAREGPGAVDAIVLLDGLHAGYAPNATGEGLDDVDVGALAPTFDFARRAVDGDRLFYFSHSRIETQGYASTSKLSALLLRHLGLRARAAPPDHDPLGLRSYVDVRGFHLRGFGGDDERAHCDHVRMFGDVLVGFVAPAWRGPG